MATLVAALFVVAHGLIHAAFVSPTPPPTPGSPQWPFSLDTSWALTPLGLDAGPARAIGVVLLVLVVAGFAVAALAVLGVVPAAWFGPATVIASVASLVMLGLFFHPWLVAGLVIDTVLLWAVLVQHWAPGAVG